MLEWWYEIGRGFACHADLLQRPVSSRAADHDVTVHLPSLPSRDSRVGSPLAAPRIGGRPATQPSDRWGNLYSGTPECLQSVIVQQLALTTEVSADLTVDEVAVSLVGAMDAWWRNVGAWLEIGTGQALFEVGDRPVGAIGNSTPIWVLDEHSERSTPFNIASSIDVVVGETVNAVTADILQASAALAAESPAFAWTMLREARALQDVGQYRRAVIDAATAAEIAITALLDGRRKAGDETDKRHLTLGRKMSLLGTPPLPPEFYAHVVEPRNDAVHEGRHVGHGVCASAIATAAEVVELAYPLPAALTGSTPQPLSARPIEATMFF